MASGNLAANAHFADFTKREFLRAFRQAGELAQITSRPADERPQLLSSNENDRADNTCSSQGGRGEGLQRRLSGWTRITHQWPWLHHRWRYAHILDAITAGFQAKAQ